VAAPAARVIPSLSRDFARDEVPPKPAQAEAPVAGKLVAEAKSAD